MGDSGWLVYLPVIVFISGLFFTGLGVAVGLTLWIMGKLTEQDAKRIELKESILLEMRNRESALLTELRERHKSVTSHIDDLRQEVSGLGDRLTRVETMINANVGLNPG